MNRIEPHPMFSLWLHGIPGMTNIKIIKLLEQAGSSEILYGWGEEQMVQNTTLTIEDIRAIIASRMSRSVEEEWMKLMEMGISYVSMEQREYPVRLRNIHNPPFGLYYKGRLPDSGVAASEMSAVKQPVDAVIKRADMRIAEPGLQYMRSKGSGYVSEDRDSGDGHEPDDSEPVKSHERHDRISESEREPDGSEPVKSHERHDRISEDGQVPDDSVPVKSHEPDDRMRESSHVSGYNYADQEWPSVKSVAVVGARSRSEYGLQLARRLGETLAHSGVDVISGLARGIDADAHIGAIDGGGRTYAVLGCGVDICYPRSNRYLYDRILDSGGGIISEYPPGQQPLAMLFPQRNRIISGLSDCVVIVEARKKSGSLITADFAMEQGRDVFAVPGRIGDALSEGTNRLIHQGAGVYIGPEEFLIDLHLGGNLAKQLNFCKLPLEKDEVLIYSVLDFNPTGLGTILQKTTVPLERLLEVLASLVEKGYVRETMPNYYAKCI